MLKFINALNKTKKRLKQYHEIYKYLEYNLNDAKVKLNEFSNTL